MADEDRMAAFDSVMWGVEDDPILRSVITVLLLLDVEPDHEVLRTRVERLTRAVPRLHRRVVGNPLSVVPPRWEDDPHFDLDYHLRFTALPRRTVSLRPLLRLAEQVAEQDFDRARPLWEMTVVTGLSAGRAALLVKLHHAITDGVGGLMLAAGLFDLDRTPATLPEPEPAVASPPLGRVGRVRAAVRFQGGVLAGAGRAVLRDGTGLAARAVRDPLGTALDGAALAASTRRLLALAPTPLSPVMRGRSLSVRFATLSVPLAELKAAGRRGGGTLNDAYVAAVTGGLRLYHAEHGDVPPTLRLHMPVNLRQAGDAAGGNRWMPARVAVPVDVADPRERIAAVAPILLTARTEPALAVVGQIYQRLSELPRPLTTFIAGRLMLGTDVVATNVPGPPVRVYLARSKVDAAIPLAPKGGSAVAFALISYDGQAMIGISVDLAAVPDPDLLLECVRAGFDEVLDLAPGRTGRTGPRRSTTPAR